MDHAITIKDVLLAGGITLIVIVLLVIMGAILAAIGKGLSQ